MIRTFHLLALGFAALAGIDTAAAAWRVFDLGAPNDRTTEIRVAAINDRGEITGGVTMANPLGVPERAAFVYSGGRFHLFGITTHQVPTTAKDINRAGIVVGGNMSAFVYDDALTPIPGLPPFSTANSVSDHGAIVGAMLTASGYRAFEYTEGIVTELGTLGGPLSEAFGVNRAGDVVGHSLIEGDFYVKAFVKPRGGVMTRLPSLGGRYNSAYAINNRGDIAGAAETEHLAKHATLWRDGAAIDLGTLPGMFYSDAVGLNDKAEVVGISVGFAPGGGGMLERPFLWSDGAMIDLAALAELSAAGFSSWITHAEMVGALQGEGPGVAINNAGLIAGAGMKNGQARLFVLSPTGRGPR